MNTYYKEISDEIHIFNHAFKDERTLSSNKELLKTVFPTIKIMGIPIIKRMSPTPGYSWGILESEFNWGATICIFLEIYFANNGPLTMAVGMPAIKPNKITHPKSAFNISATATGPGVGGIKLWVTLKPANKGIA